MDNDQRDPGPGSADRNYALSGKIMLSAVVMLFFVVILMVVLHLYARWYLLRARRRQMRRTRNRRNQLVFYVDPANPDAATRVTVPNRGLEASVLKSLPAFVYSEKTHPEQSECAVCLSEFEENEMGRLLPKCNHSFHIECIDMWFHSHSTCPLCRAPVEPVPVNPVQANPSSTSTSEITEVGSNSGLCDSCQEQNVCGSVGGPSTSSFGGRRKPVELVGVTIEVPRRTVSFEDEPGTDSPAGQGF